MFCKSSTMMYLMLDLESMLLHPLVCFKLKPRQQEKLYWNIIQFLNWMEEMEGGSNIRGRTAAALESNYGIFWDECRSIEESNPSRLASEDLDDGLSKVEQEDDADGEIQWLSDVGFTSIARKIRAKAVIDHNDDDMKIIASSLTRAQANAVRRRIDALNEQIRRQQLENDKKKPLLGSSKKRTDLRDIFPVQTQGQATQSTSTLVGMFERHAVPQSDDSSNSTQTLERLKQSQSGPRYPYVQHGKVSKLGQQHKVAKAAALNLQPSNEKLGANELNSHAESGTGFDRKDENSASYFGSVNSERHQFGASVSIKSGSDPVATSSDDSAAQSQPMARNQYMKSASFEESVAADPASRSSLTNRHDRNPPSSRQQGPVKPNSDSRLGFTTGNIIVSSYEGSARSRNVDEYDIPSPEGTLGNAFSGPGRPVSERLASFSSEISERCDRQNAGEVASSDINFCPPSDSYGSRTAVYTGNNSQISQNAVRQVHVRRNTNHQVAKEQGAGLEPNAQTMFRQPNPISMHVQHEMPGVPDHSMESISPAGQQRHSSMSSPSRFPLPASVDHSAVPNSTKPHTLSAPTQNNSKRGDVANYVDPVEQAASLSSNARASFERVSSDRTSFSGSDDSKSLSSYGSRGSSDDMQLSPTVRKKLQSTDVNTYAGDDDQMTRSQSCSDVLLASGKSSMNSRSMSTEMLPRSKSPEPVLEGDAKLKFDGLRDADSITGPSFPPLPNFTLMREELGTTRIGYLSETDMAKVRSLALIELTALFDYYQIPMNRRKSSSSKQKYKEFGVFGVPLTTLAIRESSKKTNVAKAPRILKEMLGYLIRKGIHEEGILRIPGSAPRIKLIREEIEDKFDAGLFAFDDQKPSDVSTMLKQFIRELPVPLLSSEYQNTFTSVSSFPDRKAQLQALNLLVLLLDPVHQASLQVLLDFLSKVVEQENANKMGLNNVAMIMAPNLFFENNKNYSININEAQKAAGMTDVLRMLIKYQLILWTIPSFMVSQIRYLYEAGAKTTDPKTVRKIMQKRFVKQEPVAVLRRSSGSSGDEVDGAQEQIIRIKAPTLNKQSMAMQISDLTTAADIIAKFNWRRQNSVKEADVQDLARLKISKSSKKERKKENVQFVLCESGGNIGERRLSDSAIICSVLKVNANAEWVLKEKDAS